MISNLANTKKQLAMILYFVFLIIGPFIFKFFDAPNDLEMYSASKFLQVKFFANVLNNSKKNIDIAILGTSNAETSLDAPLLQRELSHQLKTEATVYNFAGRFAGPAYILNAAENLFKYKKVKLLIVEISRISNYEYIENYLFYWQKGFRYWDLIPKLPMRESLWILGETFMGTPYHFWTALRPADISLITPPYFEEYSIIANNLGSEGSRYAYPRTNTFVELDLHPSPRPAEDYIYYNSNTYTKADVVKNWELTEMQKLVYLKLKELADLNNTKLVFLEAYLPAPINAPLELPNNLPTSLSGIPILVAPSKWLVGHYDEETIKMTFQNPRHRNLNGKILHTRALTPAILKLYGSPND